MPTSALSTFTVKLNGVPLTCISDPDAKPGGPGEGAGYSGGFAPSLATTPFVRGDVPVYLRNLGRGMGYVARRDEDDDGGYGWAEDAITYLDGNGVIPSGRRTSVSGNVGLGGATLNVPFDSVLFGSDLLAPCAANTSRILRYAGADPSATPTIEPPSGLPFNGGTAGWRSGYFAKSIAVFADNAGVPAVYVYATDNTNWRVYEYTVAGGWVESNTLGFGANSAGVTWWEGKDGTGADRLCIADANTGIIRHCIYGSDPTLAASYVTPITAAVPAYPILRLVAAPQHLYVVTTGGIRDFNEIRSWELTPYWKQNPANSLHGAPALLYDEHIMAGRLYGVDRYDVRLDGRQQRVPGECGPGMFTQDGHPIRGYVTAMCEHDGWVLAALYNPENGTTYIMRGKDRRHLEVRSRNPIVWFGAEQVLRPVGGESVRVYHMRVGPPTDHTLADGPSYLWMWAVTAWETGATDSILYYAPLPNGAGPLSLQASGGSFTFNTTAYLFYTHQNWGDRNAGKGVHRIDVVGRQLTATAKVEIRGRGDAAPATIADASTYTSQGFATANSTRLTTAMGASSIELLAILTTPSPFTAPPILDEVSPRARVVREAIEKRKLWIILERDHPLRSGAPDLRKPDTVLSGLVTLQQTATATTFVDEGGTSYQAYVNQPIEYTRVEVGGGRWRTVAGCDLSLVG